MDLDLSQWKRNRLKNTQNKSVYAIPFSVCNTSPDDRQQWTTEQYSTQVQPPSSRPDEYNNEEVAKPAERAESTCRAVVGNFKRVLKTINWEVDTLSKFAKIPVHCGLCNQFCSRGDVVLKQIAKHDIYIHRETDTKAKCGFICVACGENLSKDNCLLQHIYIHIEQRDFVCFECQPKAQTQFLCEQKGGDLRRYFSSMSMPNMALLHPEKCIVCNENIPRPDLLIFAMMQKWEQDGGFIYTCNICEKRYLDFREMQFHLLNHINRKQIVCLTCMEDILSTRK